MLSEVAKRLPSGCKAPPKDFDTNLTSPPMGVKIPEKAILIDLMSVPTGATVPPIETPVTFKLASTEVGVIDPDRFFPTRLISVPEKVSAPVRVCGICLNISPLEVMAPVKNLPTRF